ncbi:hypothetical protein PUN4_410095 [Paraburkholderia unamae]|nr:hypothetical protein PUN4_410095 [Paraburkholderia unamae]
MPWRTLRRNGSSFRDPKAHEGPVLRPSDRKSDRFVSPADPPDMSIPTPSNSAPVLT